MKRGDDFCDSLGGACRRRDDVVVDAASSTPISFRRAVHSPLTGSSSMNSCHQALCDTVFFMKNFSKRSKRVGGARRVRDLKQITQPSNYHPYIIEIKTRYARSSDWVHICRG